LAAALAAGSISPSWARTIAAWTDRLPQEHRASADEILLEDAAGGASLSELARLGEEIRGRTATPDNGPDPGGDEDGFAHRRLRLSLTFRGAGHLEGGLAPACAAALSAVLESLGKRAGPEDMRTPVQRHHDALEEACGRLTGAGFLPDRAGQPTHVQLHLTLDQLRDQPGGRDAEAVWRAGQAAGDDQPGWLSGRAARGYACDAAITPVVTGHLDPGAHDTLAGALLAHHGPSPRHGRGPGGGTGRDGCQCPGRPFPPATLARLQDTLLRYAADVLSGPGGLAAFLRAQATGGQFPAVSLPLDVGAATPTVPGHLRRAAETPPQSGARPRRIQPRAGCHGDHL